MMLLALLTAGVTAAMAQNPFADEPIDGTSSTSTNPNGRTGTGSTGLVFKYGNMHFKILSDKTVEVTGEVRSKYEGRVEIPNQVTHAGKTYKVVAIGEWAFQNCSKMTSIVIPKSIQLIKSNAFFMDELTEVFIPGDNVKIKKSAFLSCQKLQVVTINGKTPRCSSKAFRLCTKMRELRIRGIDPSKNGKKLNTGSKDTPHYAVIKVIR